jgi:uncharacterized protein YukE
MKWKQWNEMDEERERMIHEALAKRLRRHRRQLEREWRMKAKAGFGEKVQELAQGALEQVEQIARTTAQAIRNVVP